MGVNPLAALTGIARCADALERIADALEGRPRTVAPQDLPEAPADLSVSYTTNEDAVHALAIEERLRGILHRAPSPEEIVHELDGERFTAKPPAPREP